MPAKSPGANYISLWMSFMYRALPQLVVSVYLLLGSRRPIFGLMWLLDVCWQAAEIRSPTFPRLSVSDVFCRALSPNWRSWCVGQINITQLSSLLGQPVFSSSRILLIVSASAHKADRSLQPVLSEPTTREVTAGCQPRLQPQHALYLNFCPVPPQKIDWTLVKLQR